MLLRGALPAGRQSLAHSFPIYKMGSNVYLSFNLKGGIKCLNKNPTKSPATVSRNY